MRANVVLASAVLFLAFGVRPSLSRAAAQDPLVSRQEFPTAPPSVYLKRLQARPDFFQGKSGWRARTAEAMKSASPLTGTLPLVVVPALFQDSPQPYVSPAEIQQALFDGPSQYGTVSQYFQEVSGGRFHVTGRTVPWVRTSLTLEEVVGDSYGLDEDAGTGAFLFEALEAVDPGLDFGAFDNDGPDGLPNSGDDDGQVDGVVFQFLEVSASCGGPGIWPHRSRLQYWNHDVPFQSDDERYGGGFILLNDYTIQSAVDCTGDAVQTATTVAHELGHVLGLPDLYDRSQGILPEERRWVLGCWSLMAAGAWGCGSSNRGGWVRPTHMGAWEKLVLGWLSDVEVVGEVLGQEFLLPPVTESERVLKIPLHGGPGYESDEYLLVEYRAQQGFDADLPSSGVLVYHVDPSLETNQPCDTCPQRYMVGLLEADGNNSLRLNFLQGGNRGEAGDAWGVRDPKALTNSTDPSSRLNSGAASQVTVYEIYVEEDVARLVLSSRVLSAESLTQAILGTSAVPLTPEELTYLDGRGNRNGRYDVGDLRAYLKR